MHFYCALLLNKNKNSLLLDYEKVSLHQNTLLTDNKHALSSMLGERTKLWSLKWHSLSIVYLVLTISIYIDVTFFCLSNCTSLNTLTFFNNSSGQTLVSCLISEKWMTLVFSFSVNDVLKLFVKFLLFIKVKA